MKIYDELKEALAGKEGTVFTRKEIQQLMFEKYNRNSGSVIPTDYCYNRWNKGIPFTEHLFEYLIRNTFKYIGENAQYTGLIYRKAQGSDLEEVIGEWKDGVKVMYDQEGTDQISAEQLMKVYEEYLRILRYELQVLGCQPTELRHIMGRIGELICAIMTKGQLAKETNQHGFDVISEGKRISVKTTAQAKKFIPFNSKTFDRFDEIFIVHYMNEEFHILYYGDKKPIEQIVRMYGNTYEVDMEKIKRLGRQLDVQLI